MLRFCTFVLLGIALTFGARAAEGEADFFKNATDAFRDKFYERAEDQFAAFVAKFPASTNLAEAILYQAQARHFQKKHDAAIELLGTHLPKAGHAADQYVFTWADALSAKGNQTAAAEQYGRLVKDFPNSPLRLQAAYLQALSVYQLKDLPGAISLLANPEGAFRPLAASQPQERFSFAGGLLLAEALLGTGQLDDARKAAAQMSPAPERLESLWERHDILARIELAGSTPQAALPHLTNAVLVAQTAQRPRLQAQSWNIEAEVYRKLSQTLNAIASYEKIAAVEALPLDQRRLAMLKSVELHSTSGNLTNAISRLETYLTSNTNEPAADLLRVKAADLWIDRVRAEMPGGKPPAASVGFITNGLNQARLHLNIVITLFTNSPHLGRAWLNLGWTFWEEATAFDWPARMQESETAFRIASEKLTRSDDQALALFKLADTHLYLQQPKAAITNYLAVLQNYADLPQVKNSLFGRTYAQLVRAHVEIEEITKARAFLAELRKVSPNAPITEDTFFQVGQALASSGQAPEARAVFQDFLNNYPASPLAPEVRFSEARTHAVEANFSTAIQKHEQWLAMHTNHTLRAQVEFQRGILLEKIGQTTNALAVFQDFVGRFSTNALAPAAQTWIADYYYGQQLWTLAEQNYQRVFQNTNWTADVLSYQARMMAARTAFRREGYDDARSYLTTLVNDPKCPADLKPEALFALGDVFLEQPITASTNPVYNFIEGAAVFDRITNQYPGTLLAVLALAKKGDCHFQIGSHTNYPSSYVEATNAYWTVLKTTATNVPVKVLNQAEFGLARVLEKMAEGKNGADRETLLKTALNHFLNIVYGRTGPGPSDPYYLKLAAREGGRLTEALVDTEAAIQLYRRVATKAPALKSMCESRIALLENKRDQSPAIQ